MIKRSIKDPFVISFVFLVFSIVFLGIFFNKISSDNLGEQIQHRQQLATRTGAKSIENFLGSVGRTTAILADEPTQKRMDEFVDVWEDDNVVGVIATNKDGVVTVVSNREDKREVGETVNERGYFKWAMTAEKGEFRAFRPVISKIGASEGKYIVPVSSPIIRNGEFDGVVTTAILLSDLASAYLDNIEVLDSSTIYLVTSDGEIIYSDYKDLTRKSFKEIFPNEFLGKDKILEIIGNELKSNGETKIKIAIPNFDKSFKLEPYLISASPITISDNLWKVVVSVPEKDLMVFTYSIFNKQVAIIFVVVTLFIILTLRASRNMGYKDAVIEEHRIHNIEEPKIS